MTINLEIFSHEARAAAMVIVGAINWIGLIIIGMVFPFLVASMKQYCFLIFLTIIAMCGVFLYFYLPETKGKSWLEIREDFDKFNCRNQRTDVCYPEIYVLSTRL